MTESVERKEGRQVRRSNSRCFFRVDLMWKDALSNLKIVWSESVKKMSSRITFSFSNFVEVGIISKMKLEN